MHTQQIINAAKQAVAAAKSAKFAAQATEKAVSEGQACAVMLAAILAVRSAADAMSAANEAKQILEDYNGEVADAAIDARMTAHDASIAATKSKAQAIEWVMRLLK